MNPSNGVDVLAAFQQATVLHEHGRLQEAEQLYEIVLSSNAHHFDAVYRLGLIRLQQGQFADAESLFRRAVKINKRSADAHHHLAIALTGLKRLDKAIPHYQKALALRPGYAEAHNNLGYALQILDRHQEAAGHYEKALAINPSYAEARNNLGNALQALERTEEAIAQYQQALAIQPAYAEAHNNLAGALVTLRFDANERAEQSLIRPQDANVLVTLGKMYCDKYEHELAQNAFRKAAVFNPNLLPAAVGLALTTSFLDQDAEAAELLEDLIKRGIPPLDVLIRLASLPAPVVSIDLLAELEKAIRNNDSHDRSVETAFALASALDKAGRHAEAWQHLVTANKTIFASREAEFSAEAERQQSSLASLRAHSGKTVTVRDGISGTITQAEGPPISLFILGPSRSGKSTMERLAAMIDGVKRGYESPSVENAHYRTLQTAALPIDGFLENLPPQLYSTFRDSYLEELAQRAGPAKVFTNTNPWRVHDATLIATACPKARFIMMKRNLDDNLLRIYMKTYRQGNPYAYDLKAARDHIVWYYEMADLLAEKLPDIVRVVQYEDMVTDPARALRAVTELCGLAMPEGPLPVLGDDRDCAEPYRRFMTVALKG